MIVDVVIVIVPGRAVPAAVATADTLISPPSVGSPIKGSGTKYRFIASFKEVGETKVRKYLCSGV